MSTFALVHGAFHGAWCWEPLAAQLHARGHRTVAMDLPCEDPTAGTARYADSVVEALDAAGPADDLVLVGHSLGGLTIPLVADRVPVRRLVFLCGFVPQPGRAFLDWAAEEPDIWPDGPEGIGPVPDPDGLMSWPPDRAIPSLYPDCAPDVAAWAAKRLRRQSLTPHHEPCPLTAWPDVPASVVYCDDDLAVAPAWLRRVARERLRAKAYGLPGGHSPFLSRPEALADLLHRIAA